MGSDQSTIGLKMMETIYPTPGPSVFEKDQKLQLLLEKEVRKKQIHLDDLNVEEEIVDGDSDADLARCTKFVFDVYDIMEKKTPGVLSKKIGEQFFKDCFELYCMRQNKKMKDYKVDVKKAAATSANKMFGGNATINFQQFQEYINCYSIDEALADFLATSIEVEISMDVQMVDVNQFANAKREGPRLVFREYPDD